MDEKLRNAIITFLQDAYNEGNANRGCVTDTSGELEQAFRAAKWIEPKQPGGELVNEPDEPLQKQTVSPLSWHEGFLEGRKAQLAHDKATMVKLPSEDELLEMINDLYFRYSSDEKVAHELLKLLGEKP